jgi:hypothetical protein
MGVTVDDTNRTNAREQRRIWLLCGGEGNGRRAGEQGDD